MFNGLHLNGSLSEAEDDSASGPEEIENYKAKEMAIASFKAEIENQKLLNQKIKEKRHRIELRNIEQKKRLIQRKAKLLEVSLKGMEIEDSDVKAAKADVSTKVLKKRSSKKLEKLLGRDRYTNHKSLDDGSHEGSESKNSSITKDKSNNLVGKARKKARLPKYLAKTQFPLKIKAKSKNSDLDANNSAKNTQDVEKLEKKSRVGENTYEVKKKSFIKLEKKVKVLETDKASKSKTEMEIVRDINIKPKIQFKNETKKSLETRKELVELKKLGNLSRLNEAKVFLKHVKSKSTKRRNRVIYYAADLDSARIRHFNLFLNE